MVDNGYLGAGRKTVGSNAALRPDGVDRDELFKVLAHPVRRRLLARVRAREEPVSVAELAREMRDEGVGEPIGSDTTPGVAASLHHVHVPKLVEAGLVEWVEGTDGRVIRATAEGRSLPPKLSWLPADAEYDGE